MFGKTAPSGNLKKKMTILSLFFLNCFYFPFYFFFTPNLSSLSSSSPCRSAAGSAMSIPKRPQASAGCMGLQTRVPTSRVGATSSHRHQPSLSPAASSRRPPRAPTPRAPAKPRTPEAPTAPPRRPCSHHLLRPVARTSLSNGWRSCAELLFPAPSRTWKP